MKSVYYRSLASITVWCFAILYGVLLVNYSHGYIGNIDWISVLAEGLMALMPALGLAIITKVEHDKVYRLLFLGLTLLLVALLTDTLDEFVEVPIIMTHIGEGACQVIGFLILVLGFREWIVYNQLINSQLHYQATTDPLTGIANRRVFLTELDSEINRLKRFPATLSLILFDLDYFKRINDSYGHAFGDEVLKQVAYQVSRDLRDIDVFARFGGEEFIIAARQTDMTQAYNLAEKIRKVMQSISMGDINGVNASFGISEYHDGDSSKELLKRADDALYRAKESGRNAICIEEVDRDNAKTEISPAHS